MTGLYEDRFDHVRQLCDDALSCGNDAMFLERYNRKGHIVVGNNKYKANTDSKTFSCTINVNVNGPALQLYDIRRPAVAFANQSTQNNPTIAKAINQSWWKGTFDQTTKRERKNRCLEKKMEKYFATTLNDDH